MPNLKGAGAEFIPNKNLPNYSNEVIQLSNIASNEFVIGHLYGEIRLYLHMIMKQLRSIWSELLEKN